MLEYQIIKLKKDLEVSEIMNTNLKASLRIEGNSSTTKRGLNSKESIVEEDKNHIVREQAIKLQDHEASKEMLESQRASLRQRLPGAESDKRPQKSEKNILEKQDGAPWDAMMKQTENPVTWKKPTL